MQFTTMITTAMAFITAGLVNILATVNMPGATAASIHRTTTHLDTISKAVVTSDPLTRDVPGTEIHWYIFADNTTDFEYCTPKPKMIHFRNDTCLPTVDDCYALREWYYQSLIKTEFAYVTNLWDSPTAKPPQTWVIVHTINTCQFQVRLGGNTSSAFVSATDIANRVNESIYAGQFEDQDMLTSLGIMACSSDDDVNSGNRTVEWWMGCTNTSASE